jgi:hypothetical protein
MGQHVLEDRANFNRTSIEGLSIQYNSETFTMYVITSPNARGFTRSTLSSQRKGLRPVSSFSPNLGGDGFDNRNSAPKLVLPGQDGPVKRPGGGSLILPGGSSDGPKRGGALDTPEPPVGGFQNFRPPPGFMDNSGDGIGVEENLSVDEMLRNLQSNKGFWHQLATYLPKLQREGIDGTIIEEMTGIDRKTQNMWINSSMVYGSLRKSGKVPNLEFFDQDGAETLLHELRFLSVNQRVDAANYIAENCLNDVESVVLARAVKEHERRKGENEGFSSTPADCLAYKHYRDAIENKKTEDVEQYIKKGLAVAESDSAREVLERLARTTGVKAPEEMVEAKLDVVRLMKEEVGYRPIPLAGVLNSLDPEKVRNAPKVSSTGVFGKFSIPKEGVEMDWMPLPSWTSLSLASHPVAIELPNCADLEALRVVTGIETEKDALKLQGAGLIVIDIGADKNDPGAYFVGKKAGSETYDVLELKNIDDSSTVLGRVLFICRPPSRDSIIFDGEM